MLKLSGWSRLTWGRVGEHCITVHTGSFFGPRPRTRLVVDNARPPMRRGVGQRGPKDFQPSACSSTREASNRTQLQAPMMRLGWGGRRCVTPRQTCPQPEGIRRNLRSKTRWFTGFCNSHQVSHFATFFIDARAEISVAESRLVYTTKSNTRPVAHRLRGLRAHAVNLVSLALLAPGFGC